MPARDPKPRKPERPLPPKPSASPTRHAATRAAGKPRSMRSPHKVLENLAALLHTKVLGSSSELNVVAFVGAGPSSVAGLPLGAALKADLRSEFLGRGGREIRDLLEGEISAFVDRHGKRGGKESPFGHLTLFEFAAIIAKLAYGQDVLRKTIERKLGNPTHRPLAYELIAHLAKHRYLDHLVILNLDTLLDEAVDDELPERARVIAGPQHLPSPEALADIDRTRPCFLVRPFGIVRHGAYAITESDVAQFEPNVRGFLERQVLGATGDLGHAQQLLLLIVGYSGAEPAFRSLISSYVDAARVKERADGLRMVVIDPDGVPAPLEDLRRTLGLTSKIGHVPLDADTALEILVGMVTHLWRREFPVGIPAARHKLVGKCFGRAALESEQRFRLELLLQGIKSRGFVHLTGFSDLRRLTKYADPDRVQDVLDDFLRRSLLVRDRWIDPDGAEHIGDSASYVPNYMLGKLDDVVGEIMRTCALAHRSDPARIASWNVRPMREGFAVHREETAAETYLRDRLQEIESAPDIEVAQPAGRDETWFLGPSAERLWSVGELTRRTVEMLDRALRFPGRVAIRGIWATGEWLFGAYDGDSRTQPGWAFKQKTALVERLAGRRPGGPITLQVVVSRAGGEPGLRAERRHRMIVEMWRIRQPADPHARVELRWENWFDMNRVLTLVEYDGRTEAIYMRRRLSQPLVTPYFVDHPPGSKYLTELWERYWMRAKSVTEADLERLNEIYGSVAATAR